MSANKCMAKAYEISNKKLVREEEMEGFVYIGEGFMETWQLFDHCHCDKCIKTCHCWKCEGGRYDEMVTKLNCSKCIDSIQCSACCRQSMDDRATWITHVTFYHREKNMNGLDLFMKTESPGLLHKNNEQTNTMKSKKRRDRRKKTEPRQ